MYVASLNILSPYKELFSLFYTYVSIYAIIPLPQTEATETEAAAAASGRSSAPQQVAYFAPSTGWQLLSK